MTPTPPHPHTPTLTHRDLAALALLFLAAFAFCWPIFAPGWIIPQGGGDLVSFLWPTYRYAARVLHSQPCASFSTMFNPQSAICNLQSAYSALLWNPTLYSGAPFAADNQTGLFYPPNLVAFLLFPDLPYAALETLVALHLFLAGVGAYLFVRLEFPARDSKLEVGNLKFEVGSWKFEAGLVSALAFMASDVFITHLGNYNIVAVSAYLPFIFLCLRRSLSHTPTPPYSSVKWSVLAGLSLGLAALAGHAQMTLILAFACALYTLYHLLTHIPSLLTPRASLLTDHRPLPTGHRPLLAAHWPLLTIPLVAFGLAAIALLPALQMVGYTARTALSYTDASRWSLPPLGLAGAVSPLVFGRGARDFWPTWDRVEFGYMGIVALSLAALARKPRFFIALALVALVIALGRYTPVHQLLFQFVPGFASIRVPARFILLTNFSLAVLAGHSLIEKRNRPWIILAAVALASTLLILAADLAWAHPPAWGAIITTLALIAATALLYQRAPALLPLFLFAELFTFGAFVETDRADPNAGYTRGPALDYLLAQPGPTRIDLATSQWQPDAPAVFGLESITGIANPLALAAYDRYYWSVGYRGSPQYNFLGAQFVVADKNHPPADSSFVPVFNEDPAVDVYLNTNAMPRISLITDPVFVPDPGSAFAAIHDPAFNPAAQVVLESQASAVSGQPSANTNLFYTAYAPGQFTIVAQTPAPAYLVLAEVWYPGWVATLNGQPAPILRADTAFMAVLLPAGESTVAFHFTSPLLTLGAIITLITLLASVILLFILHPSSFILP
ncbi:MAG: YfhO family protein [Chloroflexi bacterium]|nr:YfhO family protein [Chloroflexota bacterium]